MIERRSAVQKYAVGLVAATSLFIMGMNVWQTYLLSSSNWCNRALGAEKLTVGDNSRLDAMTACIGLLTRQVNAISQNALIYAGTLALCLLVLVVIVLANARLNASASLHGGSLNISNANDPAAAAQRTADAAQDEADAIRRHPNEGRNRDD